MILFDIESENFVYEHLQRTQINLSDKVRETAFGLECYLKDDAENDENLNMSRTYLIRDKFTNEIAAYFVGTSALYVYALPYPKLLKYYRALGFQRLSPENETFLHKYVKLDYDEGCIFMYQTL